MSFFEKMMRVHTQLPSQPASNRPSPVRSNRSSSLQSVPDQPIVSRPRLSKPPVLMQHKMIDRAKMFSDLMNRKREFEMKHLATSKRVVGSSTKTDSLRLEKSEKIERNNQYEHSRQQQTLFERSMGERQKEDSMTRQLVGRLLTMLEQERSHPILQPPVQVQAAQQPQPQAQPQKHQQQPIIINNILRSPVESLSKDLIEKQMKIRILQQQRRERHKRSRSRQPTMRSPRNNSHRSINTLELSVESNMTLPLSSSSSTHQKKTINIDDKDGKASNSGKKNITSEVLKETNHIASMKENEFQSTNFNSEQPSNIKDIEPVQRNRKIPTASPASNPSSLITVSSDEPISKPVRLEFNIESETSGMTLAQAFKKKIGRLKSQQNKQIKASPKKSKKDLASNSQVQTFNGTAQNSQNISINIETYRNPSKKHSVKSTIKSNTEVKKDLKKSDDKKQEKMISGRSREPSTELMDRLIYGEKVKMTKSQMLALTRKNYANLPEVQAKKKEQEKRIAEQERLAKVKQYQRSIRSNKSIKRDE